MSAAATTQKAQPISISGRWIAVGTIVLVVTALTVIVATLTASVALISLVALLYSVFAFTHGVLRYGLRTMVVFLVVVVVVGWSYESLSIQTGFPFGDYYYSSGLGAKVGQVPVAIMPSYFAFGYLSWTLASILIGKRDNKLSGSDMWVLPVVASFLMVIWDVCMDPICSTLFGEWIWEDGGPYFGVPLTNFMGWFLTVLTFYLVFALYLRVTERQTAATAITTRGFWILAILMYTSIAIEFWVVWVQGAGVDTVTDQTGQVWQTVDILSSMVLISVFTMIFLSLVGVALAWHQNLRTAEVSTTSATAPQG